MENTTLTKDQVKGILDNAPANLDRKVILQRLVERGYKLEGLEVPQASATSTREPGLFQAIGSDVSNRLKTADKLSEEAFSKDTSIGQGIRKELQAGGQYAAAVGDVAGNIITRIPILGPLIKNVGEKVVDTKVAQDIATKYQDFSQKYPEAAKDLEAVFNYASVLPIGEGTATLGKSATKGITSVADDVLTTTGKVTVQAAESLGDLKKGALDVVERIKQPDVSEATKVSLNPIEAMKGTGQDIQISVGGKLKNLSEITPTENMKIKSGTARIVDKFTDQAEKFSKDRSVPGGSPVEIVGDRTDKALSFADKKRMTVGNRMGEIETKYATEQIPISDKVHNSFKNVYKMTEDPKFGVSSTKTDTVRKFVEDFGKLDTEGATVADRNDFIRTWTRYIEDQKDSFGKFKDSAYENTQIQKAINDLKGETVDAISKKDKTYRNLRKSYAIYKELDEIGNKLLGQEGALGQRVKGSSIIKRAIQSNSDAGARQFLIKLRELTGYDAIKEGDLALLAMENVGDYQGLSLLNIIKEGKSGIVMRALEKGQDILVGDKVKRVKNYMEK